MRQSYLISHWYVDRRNFSALLSQRVATWPLSQVQDVYFSPCPPNFRRSKISPEVYIVCVAWTLRLLDFCLFSQQQCTVSSTEYKRKFNLILRFTCVSVSVVRVSPFFYQNDAEGSLEVVDFSPRSIPNYYFMSVKLCMKHFIYWTADEKSSKLWSSQLWTQFMQLRI